MKINKNIKYYIRIKNEIALESIHNNNKYNTLPGF